MTNTAVAPKPATVRVVHDGTSVYRYSVATGALLGSLTLNDWNGKYTVSHVRLGKMISTLDRNRALHALALCA